MHRQFARVCCVLLVLTSLGLAQEKKKENSVAGARKEESAPMPSLLPSEETVSAFLHQMFGYDSSITWKILAIKPAEAEGLAEVNVLLSSPQGQGTNTIYVTSDQKHAVVGEIIPFGTEPFTATREKLEKGENGIAKGPAKAPIEIVEFSDLQCPHCKQAEPTLEKLMTDEPNARFVFQPFPIPSHDWAMKAASFADCVSQFNYGAFWKYVDSVFNAQSEITAANADQKLTELADAAGVKGSQVATCAARPDIRARIEHSIALGRSAGVTGTPTVFIGGRKIANVNGTDYEILKNMVEFYAKENKGEKK
ncbi:MAG TPA: thioredoxin domain-containing protein [Terriglobales bacterium]|nr:thioredoxin domain-containing protein [Terriglobales bacterium]